MITVSETVHTALDPAQTFAYLSAFEHTSEWDPGTPVVEKRSQGAVAVGSQYYAEAEFRGKRQPIDYVVTELDDHRIQLRGENKTVISVDTITVTSAEPGSAVTYTAEFSIKGWLRVAEPFMRSTFQKLAQPAVEGMRSKLDSLAS